MTIEIQMPALSPTMEKGTLAKWLVSEGDEIRSGDIIAEIETDKATMEVEAADDGRVGKLVVAEGTPDVPVGQVIAVLLEDGEDEGDIEALDSAPKPKDQSRQEAEKDKTKATKAPEQAEKAPTANAPSPRQNGQERVFASPLARRIAAQSGIDLSAVKGSGPGGRVVKRDLEGAAPLVATTEKPAPGPAAVGDMPVEEVKLTSMRKVIAQRLTEAKQTVPHFYLTVDVAMDRLLALRKQVNEEEDLALSVNDFLIKALAAALRKVPDANVQYAGDKLLKFGRVDVSVAVAIDGGLVTPVIRGADSKGVAAIGAEMRALAEKARAGKLTPEEYQGGTVSLSNLGMYGIKQFDAVINPPQAAILAVGAAEERAVIRDGEIVPARVMTATLSCDHRAIDGAIGANLLTTFKQLVENPIKMLL
ncbi:MAG: pyruvate dehydrogenase complex dihydrolipoamide acetyltransferase [Alphaproteobacteria bacterium]|nr:MAG: pyruvate dehydrogenase complex dihydrolipoamide acetyltransferase [Alphaproteobacteria bacterium]